MVIKPTSQEKGQGYIRHQNAHYVTSISQVTGKHTTLDTPKASVLRSKHELILVPK